MTPALCCACQFPLAAVALVWSAKESLTATAVGVMKQGSTFPANPIFVYLPQFHGLLTRISVARSIQPTRYRARRSGESGGG